jgi:predicted Zn-dependent protease
MNPRITQLQTWLQNEPNDAFLLYALATEYKNIDTKTAIQHFENLLLLHPTYLATYYHLAQLYAETEQSNKAEKTFLDGIALAKEQKEQKTLAELQSAYNNFLYE